MQRSISVLTKERDKGYLSRRTDAIL